MSRFEIALNFIFGGIFLAITSANPIAYVIGVGIGNLLIVVFEMVNDRG